MTFDQIVTNAVSDELGRGADRTSARPPRHAARKRLSKPVQILLAALVAIGLV